MKAAVRRQHAGSFLPDVCNKRRRETQHWRRQESKRVQILAKEEIALFRNSLKQNICVEMLQQGFHRSFSELFTLLRWDQDRRAAAEPGSALWSQTPLEEQRDKLETMKLHLSLAEQAEHTGSWSAVQEQRLCLGRYFSAPEDLWLSSHFYLSCTNREEGSRSRPACEARVCLAELHLQRGDLQEAKEQAELCVQLADDSGWTDSAGRPLRLRARQVLWRIYSNMADVPMAREDHREALRLLHEGYSLIRECKGTSVPAQDKQIEGEAVYRLGLTYQRAGDHDSAKQFFNTCMQIFGTLQDPDGLGKAYKAMAKSTESEGNIDETVQYLERFADVSRSNGLQHNLADACLCLGNIYNACRQYDRAAQCFLQGYEVACDLGDVALLQKTQVSLASAHSHAFTRTYSADVASATPAALRRVLAWKQTRGGQEVSGGPDNPAAAWGSI